MKPKDPRTPREWQEAVDLAEFWILLDSARQYGLAAGRASIWTGASICWPKV